jgi:uncharacterized protein YgbK (DUF1537 family)
MTKLLIIADDFTGALDSGVQLSASGVKTKVITDISYDFRQAEVSDEVIVIDTESRHIASSQAYQIVYDITLRAVDAGIPYIFKKTDSALRGNIGAELTAVLKASGEKVLPFAPAFPEMRRTTVNGRHYVDGELLENSVFSQDPFEPARMSYIPDIIAQQSKVNVKVISEEMTLEAADYCEKRPVIWIFDCETDEQLRDIVDNLRKQHLTRIMAGCAGAASILPSLLNLKHRINVIVPRKESFFIVCGSVNPVTLSQMDYAEKHGFERIRLTPREKLENSYWTTESGSRDLDMLIKRIVSSPLCILDSNDLPGCKETLDYAADHQINEELLRKRIPENLGVIIERRLQEKPETTLMIMGGDTLMGFFHVMGINEVRPICELFSGVVLSTFLWRGKTIQVITKSGGFGRKTLLEDIAEKVMETSKNHPVDAAIV